MFKRGQRTKELSYKSLLYSCISQIYTPTLYFTTPIYSLLFFYDPKSTLNIDKSYTRGVSILFESTNYLMDTRDARGALLMLYQLISVQTKCMCVDSPSHKFLLILFKSSFTNPCRRYIWFIGWRDPMSRGTCYVIYTPSSFPILAFSSV